MRPEEESVPEYLTLPLEGCHNIEASAGTGKTTALSLLYLSVILSGVPPEKILVVTFTNAAAQDVRERIRELLGDVLRALLNGTTSSLLPDARALLGKWAGDTGQAKNRVKAALDTFDLAPIQTIHSFCQSLLKLMSFLLGTPFDISLVPEDDELALESSVHLWRSLIYGKDPLLAEFAGNLWSKGPSAMQQAIRNVVARNHPPLEMEKTVLDAFRNFTGFRSKAKNALADIPFSHGPSELVERLAEMSESREIPALGLVDIDQRIPEFLVESGMSEVSLIFSQTLQSAEILSRSLRTYFNALAGFRKVQDLADRERKGMATYDDLIVRVAMALDREGVADRLRERFPVAFVDESQDTSRDQVEIFERIYRTSMPGSALFWIGDPKQSIYRFRGADLNAYIDARERFQRIPGNRQATLPANYRSVPGIVEAVNRLFHRHPAPFLMDRIRFDPATPVPGRISALFDPAYPAGSCFFVYSGETPDDTMEDFARTTAEEVERLLSGDVFITDGQGKRQLVPSDIAILVRINTHAERIATLLHEKGIPCSSPSPVPLFHTKEADELAILLDALLSPGRMPAVALALATRILGWSAREISRCSGDPREVSRIQGHFLASSRLWYSHGLKAALDDLFFRFSVWPSLLSRPRVRQRIGSIVARIEEAVSRHPTPPEQRSFLEMKRQAPTRKKEEETVGGNDGEGVRIMTVFKSKGLEFPVVFLPFGLPKQKNKVGTSADRDAPGEDDEDTQEDSDEGEDIRLLYVALTRARERIYLFTPMNRVTQFSLHYILRTESRIAASREKRPVQKRLSSLREAFSDHLEGVEGVVILSKDTWKKGRPFRKDKPDSVYPPEGWIGSKKLDREIPAARQVTSFTSLIKRKKDSDAWNGDDPLIGDETDRDFSENLAVPDEPSGRMFGILVHRILEEVGRHIVRNIHETGTRPGRTNVDQWIRESLVGMSDTAKEEEGRAAVTLVEKALYSPLSPWIDRPLLEVFDGKTRFEQTFLLSPPARPGDGMLAGNASHLRGVIDVVLWVGSTVYLIDYKTNLLSGEGDTYGKNALEQILRDNHYDLQARIYSRALTNHLAASRAEVHFGGFLFLFLRGMDPSGSPSGKILWKPEGN